MTSCRSCGGQDLKTILSLGKLPLANALLTQDELSLSEDRYPLDFVFCPKCTLVQITETIEPEKLFKEYLYFSSFSETMLLNAKNIVRKMVEVRSLSMESFVVEIASNDGYLLKNYLEKNIPVLGIEPASNVAEISREKGIPTLDEFFNADSAHHIRSKYGEADVIHANNVIAHVADLHGVIEGIRTLLKPDGVAVIENHYVKNLMDGVEFDSIYHEHLCYYSVTSFKNLFLQHGLDLVDVEHIPVHGGSLRVYFQRVDGPRSLSISGSSRVDYMLREEASWQVDKFSFYQNFGIKVEKLRNLLLSLLRELKSKNNRIVVYGASAKSTTLLNYFRVGADVIDYVVDRSTVKQGYYTPGTHLKIFSPEKLLEDQPDYVLLLSWNFADEIISQQAEYKKRGGRFIIPIPEMRVI